MQETADGDRRAAVRPAFPSAAVVVNLVRPDELGRRRPGAGARRAGDLDAAGSPPTSRRAGVDAGDALVADAPRRGARPRRRGGRSRTSSGTRGRGARPCRRTSCRGWPAGIDLRRPLRAGRAAARAGDGMSPASDRSRHRVGPLAVDQPGRAATGRRRAARRPRDRDHRLLRLGRRRQDHHLRGAGAARRRARPQGRRAHHRPGPTAGAVDGHRAARQHPAAGPGCARRRRPQGGSARRDDARHEAHLRRGGREPGHPGEGPADPGEPVLRRPVELVRRHPGVHGDGEAGPDPPRRRSATAATT